MGWESLEIQNKENRRHKVTEKDLEHMLNRVSSVCHMSTLERAELYNLI